jgi:hypothetical protein
MFSDGIYFIYTFASKWPKKEVMYYISRCKLDEDVGKGTVLGSVKVQRDCSRNRAKRIVLEGVENMMVGLDLFLDEVPVLVSWDGDFRVAGWKGWTFIGRV